MTSEAGGNMQALVEHMARALVEEPDKVSVEPFQEGGAVVFELRVAPGDLGRVIGKHGRNARSMRAILNAAAITLEQRAALEIIEE